MSTRIATSPLTGRIHQGHVSKDGTAFVGEKRDVTSDVLCAVIEKAEFHGGSFEIEGGGEKWTVTVSKDAFGSNSQEIEQALAHDLEHLNCPHCGGSGHIGDTKPRATGCHEKEKAWCTIIHPTGEREMFEIPDSANRAQGCPDTMDDTGHFAEVDMPAFLRKQAG